MIDIFAAVNVPTVVVTLVLVLFYDVPIKAGFRWLRGLTRTKS